jgi:hypothetical protein
MTHEGRCAACGGPRLGLLLFLATIARRGAIRSALQASYAGFCADRGKGAHARFVGPSYQNMRHEIRSRFDEPQLYNKTGRRGR